MEHGKQKFEGIQALRAIAALAVVLFHTLSTFNQQHSSLPDWINSAIQRGNVGVDLFFVISGFVITLSMRGFKRSGDSSLSFLIKRFFRIVPAYWVVTIIYIYYFPHVDLHLIERSLLLLPSKTSEAPYYGVPVLYVGWSLVYEMYFYLIFGVSLFFGRRSILVVFLYFAVTLVVAPMLSGGAFSLATNGANSYHHPYVAMATNPMIAEFVYGIGSALLYRALRRRFGKTWLALFLSASVVMTLACIAKSQSGFDIIRHGLPFAGLIVTTALAEDGCLIRVPRFAVYLGEISYGIYLVHPVVLLFLARTRPLANGPAHIEAIEYGLALVISILVAGWLHRYVEQPCIQIGRRLASRIAATLNNSPIVAPVIAE
jgi:peptidoglycan/LPS O-acetylase OafA/YrhL